MNPQGSKKSDRQLHFESSIIKELGPVSKTILLKLVDVAQCKMNGPHSSSASLTKASVCTKPWLTLV